MLPAAAVVRVAFDADHRDVLNHEHPRRADRAGRTGGRHGSFPRSSARATS
jgi:hypothetical protein